jgi:NTP pyrophosphatase (non-canonical NTP hydrolase)
LNRIELERYEGLGDYQSVATQFANYPNQGSLSGLVYTILGANGEAGELSNKIKKVLRDSGGELTEEAREKLLDEGGDVLWYLSAMCNELDVSLEHLAYRNLEKLAGRHARGTLKGSGDNR